MDKFDYNFFTPFNSVSSDYLDDVSNNGMIVLNGDTSVLNVSFTIVGDSIFELLEELSASLSFSSSSVAGVTLAPTSAEIIILDNDGKSIMTFRELKSS